jgi:hypothetical protein
MPRLAHLAAQAERAVADLWTGQRPWQVSRVRRLVCHLAVCRFGSSGAAVVGGLGVTTCAVNRAAWTDLGPEEEDIRQVASEPTPPSYGDLQQVGAHLLVIWTSEPASIRRLSPRPVSAPDRKGRRGNPFRYFPP